MKLKNIHLQIPNALTLLNLLLGCIGIVYAFDERYFIIENVSTNSGLYDVHEVSNRLFTSCFLLIAAAVIDFFDGFVARALNAQSELGKQLDSLADVVTFGVLPGIIYYQLLERSFFMETGALHTSKIWMIAAFLIPVAAAIRLGRFNIASHSKEYFIGLASPAQAIFAASLPLILITNNLGLAEWVINKYVLYALVIIMSYLMIAPIKLFSLKPKSFQVKENISIILLLLIGIISIIFFQYAGIAISILTYVALNIFMPLKDETTENLN
jgi:CDP-diacylglycerol--serine O-phosphatidyltransferase